jgi:hypothetical protein
MYDTWFYGKTDHSVGPLNLKALQEVLNHQPEWQEVLVWRQGFNGWKKAGSVDEIAALFITPPPIPKTKSPQQSGKRGWHRHGKIATGIYAIGLFAFFNFLFDGDRVLGTAALMLLGTLGDIRIGRTTT